MKSGATPQQMWTQVPTANKIASVIKSIQVGEGTIASGSGATENIRVSVAITAVVLEKSVCYWGGSGSTFTNANNACWTSFESNTSVRLERASEIGGTTTGRFTVVEFY